MRTFLTADTDVATFVLFDPAAVPAEAIDVNDLHRTVDVLCASGQALAYSYAGDGGASFLVLVDEEPDPELVKRRAHGMSQVLLHVPSGRLTATGMEDLWRIGEQRIGPADFKPEMGSVADIPAGDYVVEAFEVDWQETPEEQISARAMPGDQRFVTILGTTMGFVIAATILLMPGICCVVWTESGYMSALYLLGYTAFFHAVFWAIVVPIVRYSKAWNRMEVLRDEVDAEYPGNVVVLRRLKAGETPPSAIGKYGCGFA